MSTEVKAVPSVHRFFSRHGALSKWHPNYEYRPGQLAMAEAVESALADRKHLIVEAGTGTGKTLAYLVPAILSGKRIVVSTGTKNLQEQLFFKDIPFLQQHFPRPLRVCYMKGRNNYACRQKIYDADREAVLTGLEEVADFQVIQAWEQTTEIGDRAEIKKLPEQSTAWAKVDARSDLCTGQKCKQYERCFLTLMHQRAQASDIVIVNHHLFFADLALKEVLEDGDTEGGILPEYHAVVFDEAHEIEDVAGSISASPSAITASRSCAATFPPWPAPRNSAPPSWIAFWTVSRNWLRTCFRCFPRRRAAPHSQGAPSSWSATKRSTATCTPRWNWSART